MARPLRTNNPSEWTALDGVYIDEIKPPGRIANSGSAVVCIVGQFQMGPYTPTTIGSSGHLLETFGSGEYSGYKSLMSKRFSNLIVKRVKGTGATAATATLTDEAGTPVDSIVATANYDGVYANGIKVKSVAASSGQTTERNILVTWGAKTQVFEDVTLAKLPLKGKFVTLTKKTDATTLPALNQEKVLAGGTDGTFSTTNYTTAIDELEAYEGITILFTDDGTKDVNDRLIYHCNLMGDRYPILHLEQGTDKDAAITAADTYRGALDRGSLAWPSLYQYNIESDKTELTNPAAWAASIISMIPEEWDPAIVDAAQYLSGVKGLEFDNLNRTDYIQLKNAGIMAFEYDKDIGYKIKSGVTLSKDAALVMVFRRRMCDKLTSEIGSALKQYQNKPMNEDVETDVLGAITKYLQDMKDKNRVKDFTVDGDSMNTPTSRANGEYHVLIVVQLYASMRYIVLHAQVGETVIISERSAA